MIERWKPVVDFPDYEVSDQGNVRSLKFGKIKPIKAPPNGQGYRIFTPYQRGEKSTLKVAIEVAKAFLGHTSGNGLIVDHHNNIRDDDRLANLQLISRRENATKDQFRHNRTSDYTGVTKIERNKWIARIVVDGKQIHLGTFTEELDAAKAYQKKLLRICYYKNKSD